MGTTHKPKTNLPIEERRPKEEVFTDILSLLERGLSLLESCRQVTDAPRASNVLRWCERDPQGFGARYNSAREIGYRLLADNILEIADAPCPVLENGATDSGYVAHQRLRVDTRRWMLSKMLPKIYGDRVETVHSGSMEINQPIEQVRLELAAMLALGNSKPDMAKNG